MYSQTNVSFFFLLDFQLLKYELRKQSASYTHTHTRILLFLYHDFPSIRRGCLRVEGMGKEGGNITNSISEMSSDSAFQHFVVFTYCNYCNYYVLTIIRRSENCRIKRHSFFKSKT